MHTSGRWLSVMLLVLASTSLVVSASPAAAHPVVLRTLPEGGTGYAEPPTQIGLVLDEPVVVQSLTVRGQARGPIATSAPTRSPDGRTITVTPDRSLPDGTYTVRWQITATDGDIVEGTFGFGVGVATNPATTSRTGTVGSRTAAALRWVLFGGLAVALGGLAGNSIVRDRARRARQKSDLELAIPRPWVLGGSILGLVAAVLLAFLQTGGELLAGPTGFSINELTSSRSGRLLMVEASGFILGALAAIRLRPPVALAGLLAVVVAEAWRSHLNVRSGWLGSVTIGTHLLVAALWVGALAHLIRTAYRWRNTPRQVVAIFRRYARYALAGYLLVIGTGALAAVLLMPSWQALTSTTYGRILLVKIALVAIVTVVAFAARRGIHRPMRIYRWRGLRFARLEVVLLAGVLVGSATLTAASPPRDVAEATFPSPVVGPAVRVGTLAGQVSTGLIASQDGLQVRLHVPEAKVDGVTRYRVRGSAVLPSGETAALKLKSCGTGCFTSIFRWQRGATEIKLSVAADRWIGGAVNLVVPWPPRDGEAEFQRMLGAMARQTEVRINERVTSNTRREEGMSSTLTVSGKELLTTQPYRSGIVSAVAILDIAGDRMTIGFGLTAESIYVRMTIDEVGRIRTEQISSPNHLIDRRYSYPTSR